MYVENNNLYVFRINKKKLFAISLNKESTYLITFKYSYYHNSEEILLYNNHIFYSAGYCLFYPEEASKL